MIVKSLDTYQNEFTLEERTALLETYAKMIEYIKETFMTTCRVSDKIELCICHKPDVSKYSLVLDYKKRNIYIAYTSYTRGISSVLDGEKSCFRIYLILALHWDKVKEELGKLTPSDTRSVLDVCREFNV